MHRYFLVLFLLLFLILPAETKAQVEGLWLVKNVEVGDQEMTPVQKWTRIEADGTFETGNGWLQNGSGTYRYNAERQMLSVETEVGFEDSFGPFTLSFPSEETMIWKRMENGENVTVHYSRVDEIPRSPKDLAVGIWEPIMDDAQSGSTAGKEESFIFIRWDNLFTRFGPDSRQSGIWRVGAHRPVLDILFYDDQLDPEYWQLSFKHEDHMILSNDAGLEKHYKRLNSFPE